MSDIESDHAIALELARQLAGEQEAFEQHGQLSHDEAMHGSSPQQEHAHLTDFYASTSKHQYEGEALMEDDAEKENLDVNQALPKAAGGVCIEMGTFDSSSGAASIATTAEKQGPEQIGGVGSAHDSLAVEDEESVGVDESWYLTAKGEFREASDSGPEVPKAEQRAMIHSLMQSVDMLAGDHWYLVDQSWFSQWATYVDYYERESSVSAIAAHSYSSHYTTHNDYYHHGGTGGGYSEDDYGGFDYDDECSEKSAAASHPQPLETVFRARPPPVDCLPLLEENSLLCRKHLREDNDYISVCPQVWNLFMDWYGGGPAVRRQVISTGLNNLYPKVDVRPNRLRIIRGATGEVRNMFYSDADTVGDLLRDQCRHFHLSQENVRIWDFHDNTRTALLTELHKRLDDVQIYDEQAMLIEERGADGEWPLVEEDADDGWNMSDGDDYHNDYSYPSYSTSSTNYYHSPAYAASSSSTYPSYCSSSWGTIEKESVPGTAGLCNLGNTCYLNSSLQCLSNFTPLTSFFLSKEYEGDLNTGNPLGYKGVLASGYSTLLRQMWSGKYRAINPTHFRKIAGECCSQFAGYAQQDSQELLSFLLDGLHEDLNRVLQKPLTEQDDSPDRPDHIAAQEEWGKHKLRNDSVIVDYCQGQLKNRLQCPVCGKLSIKFDPFMCLSVPLPVVFTENLFVTVFRHDPALQPTRYKLELPPHSTPTTLRAHLAELCAIDPNRLYLAEVYQARFFRTFNDPKKLLDITKGDNIVAYELLSPIDCAAVSIEDDIPAAAAASTSTSCDTTALSTSTSARKQGTDKEDIIRLRVVFSNRTMIPSFYGGPGYVRKNTFGHPLVLTVSSSCTYAELYQIIWNYLQPYVDQSELESIRDAYAQFQAESELGNEAGSGEEIQAAPQPDASVQQDDQEEDAVFESVELDEPSSPLNRTDELTNGQKPGDSDRAEETTTTDDQSSEDDVESRRDAIIDTDADEENDHAAATAYALSHFQAAEPANPSLLSEASRASQMINQIRARASGRDVDTEDDDYDESGESNDDEWDDNAYGETLAAPQFSSRTNPMYRPPSTEEKSPLTAPVDPDHLFDIIRTSNYGVDAIGPSLNRDSLEPLGFEDFSDIGIVWDFKLAERLLDLDQFKNPPVDLHSSCAEVEQEEEAPLKLSDCFDQFGIVEELGEDDGWYCSQCKEHRPALKTLTLWRLPAMLIVHLKRFGSMQHKITDHVEFPLEDLDLSKWAGDKGEAPVYNLFGVSNHYGDLQGGHYTAYAKNPLNNAWYSFDDSAVKEISPAEVCNQNAYVLFYERSNAVQSAHREVLKEYGKGASGSATKSAVKHPQADSHLDGSRLPSSASGYPHGVDSYEMMDSDEMERRTESRAAIERECVRDHVPIGSTFDLDEDTPLFENEVPSGSENDPTDDDDWTMDDPASELPAQAMDCGSEDEVNPEDELPF